MWDLADPAEHRPLAQIVSQVTRRRGLPSPFLFSILIEKRDKLFHFMK
ncbi:hypothetical protein PsAD14_05720 [Pseudovibrio sp. Ad14]|nr:hypothetical protein PsW74_05460 [Pseudovibrio sp. W74]KZL03190.1 hypothetical protein PsAD14_05720 [Pseudovibrio sp. Ad14]